MRMQSIILVVALIVAAAITFTAKFFGVVTTPLWGLALGLACGFILAVSLLMAQYAMSIGVKELVKQIAVWLAIVALLPLTVWYGTSSWSPPPDWKRHQKSTARTEEKIRDTKEVAEKEKLRDE